MGDKGAIEELGKVTPNDEQAKYRPYSYIDDNGRRVNVTWWDGVRVYKHDDQDKRPRIVELDRPMLSDREL